MIDIKNWLEQYKNIITNEFGERVLFIGIQGSYSRGEQTEHSDIDPVLILDRVSVDDLKIYRKVTADLPENSLLCGFVSGKDEIYNWYKPDLFQLYFDTTPILGDLKNIMPAINKDDARCAALMGACNIYHLCSHNFLHTVSHEKLKKLYKSGFFVLQAKHYFETGIYIHTKKDMLASLTGKDKEIIKILNESSFSKEDFEKQTAILLEWVKSLISIYGDCSK